MKKKNIMIVGGGSGGHLTPLLAVAQSIKQKDSSVVISHVGQKNEGLNDVIDKESVDNFYEITAGKFRRYHGESFLAHLLDVKTLLLNFRDLFRFIHGTLEAWRLLGKVRPDSILLKGGFVCVPVGFAARFRRIPYLTHDSDAVPGLANRLTSGHATYNTTALPTELYPYDQTKTIQVGIPIRKEFVETNEKIRNSAKSSLDIDTKAQVLLSVGGGLGAQRLNIALVNASKQLLTNNAELIIIHLTGKKLFDETEKLYSSVLNEELLKRVKIIDFTTDIYKYSEAADFVLTRAGATNIAEFATQAKPCIVVPNPMLTGGQQLHNAKVLQDADAAIILYEENLGGLGATIESALSLTDVEKNSLGSKLNSLAIPDSADKIAILLLEIAEIG